MASEPIHVPAIGEPEYTGEITDGQLSRVIAGQLVPNQSFAKAMARALREYMREEQSNGK